MTTRTDRFTLTRIGEPNDFRSQMIADVRAGLMAEHKTLPSIYFYDDHGSALFEEITTLPEYYLTRAEAEILEANSDEIIAAVQPDELVEIGAGYARKTRLLLTAMRDQGAGDLYSPIDVSEAALQHAGENLTAGYSWLRVRGYVGDFGTDLAKIPRVGTRLVAFLGSTVGNLPPQDRRGFFTAVASMLAPGDGFLLGIDLLKDERVLTLAYNDSAGRSAAFNKNILSVINRELDGDFELDDFTHLSKLNKETGCMQQHLVAERPVVATLKAADLTVTFAAGESMHTEWSCKFTREGIASELGAAGLQASRWWTDEADQFGVVLATPLPISSS